MYHYYVSYISNPASITSIAAITVQTDSKIATLSDVVFLTNYIKKSSEHKNPKVISWQLLEQESLGHVKH